MIAVNLIILQKVANCNLLIKGGGNMYERFEQLLKSHNVTPYRVSKETGITTATLTKWKQGKFQPKFDKLLKIANYFGVDVSYLLPEYK